MAQLVDENGFEIVGARALRRGEAGWRGEGGLAVVAEESVSASRICPTNAAGGPEPSDAPGAFAVKMRVKARTPEVKPMLGWLKQMELRPLRLDCWSFEQESAAAARESGAMRPG
jgi:hypothetical protein